TKRLDVRAAEEKLLSRVERKRAVIKFEVTQMTTWPSKVLRALAIKNTWLLTLKSNCFSFGKPAKAKADKKSTSNVLALPDETISDR
ncbi:MAG: hypothetical protein DRR08_29530, partial [Candidatus Parabeggiatoa sp. nov. 2]